MTCPCSDRSIIKTAIKANQNDSIADAVADLGRPDEIGRVFAGFQNYLYQGQDGVWQAERTY
jgi:type I restriction enzyme R subunit